MIIGASGAKPSRTADLERKLVHHCSPALAGLKPANMFVYREGIDADAFPGRNWGYVVKSWSLAACASRCWHDAKPAFCCTCTVQQC